MEHIMHRIAPLLFSILLAAFGAAAHAQDQTVDQTHRRIAALRTLLDDGQQRRAEALLAQFIRTAQSPQAGARYAALLAEAQRSQPFQLHGSFGLLPSTNVNRAATATTFSTLAGDFTIDDGGDARSGLGLNVRLGATYRLPLDTAKTLQLSGQIGRTLYDEDVLRSWSGQLHAEIVQRQPQQTLRYGVYVSHRRHDVNASSPTDSPNAWRYALHASWSQDLGDLRRTVSGRLEYRDYVEQDARDGPYAKANIGWSMSVHEQGQLQWGVGLERHIPDLAYQRNWGVNAQLGYTHQITETFRLGGSLGATFRRYDTDFATVGYARTDDIYRIGLSASDTRIKIAGAVPTLSCSYTDHRSNIALYETSYTDCSVTLSFAF
jgi:hypothetical protein